MSLSKASQDRVAQVRVCVRVCAHAKSCKILQIEEFFKNFEKSKKKKISNSAVNHREVFSKCPIKWNS